MMTDEITKLRAALENLRAHVEGAFDDWDEGGSYKTAKFKESISQADYALGYEQPMGEIQKQED